MQRKFLDQAGLVALWGKIKAYGGKTLKVLSNDNSAKDVIVMNENTNDKTLEIKGDGTWISGAATTSTNKVTITLSHNNANTASVNNRIGTTSTGDYAFGTEYTVLSGIEVDADDKGHLSYPTSGNSAGLAGRVTKQKIKDTNREIDVNGTPLLPDNVHTPVDFVNGTGINVSGSSGTITHNLQPAKTNTLGGIKASNVLNSAQTLTSANGSTADRYYGVQVDSNGVAFVNVPWTDSQNVGTANLTLKADKVGSSSDSSGGTVFNANETTNKGLDILGDGTKIETTRTAGTNKQTVTVTHKAVTANSGSEISSNQKPTYNSAATYAPLSDEVISDLSVKVDTTGHVESVTPTYKKIPLATSTTAGLMSAADKDALNQVNQTIANALTSAITPKGGITPYELQQAVTAQETILSAAHVGDLYRLIDEDDTTDPNYGKPLAIGNTQSNDIVITYSNFVEGGSLTNNGTQRHEFSAGTYVMVVNTGTAQSPVYKLDTVSGLYDMSNYWMLEGNNALIPIPLDTDDPNYTGPNTTADPTIASLV